MMNACRSNSEMRRRRGYLRRVSQALLRIVATRNERPVAEWRVGCWCLREAVRTGTVGLFWQGERQRSGQVGVVGQASEPDGPQPGREALNRLVLHEIVVVVGYVCS